jgi:hypothetical protein
MVMWQTDCHMTPGVLDTYPTGVANHQFITPPLPTHHSTFPTTSLSTKTKANQFAELLRNVYRVGEPSQEVNNGLILKLLRYVKVNQTHDLPWLLKQSKQNPNIYFSD